MDKQITIDGLPPKDSKITADKNARRRWEKGFQRWSDKKAQDGSTPLGKCGYGSMCDYCTDNCYGSPCVRALNAMCKERKIAIDYTKKNYTEIWNNG